MNIPANLKYTSQHEWIRIEENKAIVGITDFAQSQLGDIVFVDLPEVGQEISKDDNLGVVESVKAVSDVYCPVSGSVLEVNEKLLDAPELMNQSPYEDGWIAVIDLGDRDELAALLNAAEYAQLAKEES